MKRWIMLMNMIHIDGFYVFSFIFFNRRVEVRPTLIIDRILLLLFEMLYFI